jgi:hypothetical protein
LLEVNDHSVNLLKTIGDGFFLDERENSMNFLNLKKETPAAKNAQPQMLYQVLADGAWTDVSQALEMEGGCLRYTVDGWSRTATAGNWRGAITEEYVTKMAIWAHTQRDYRNNSLMFVVVFVLVVGFWIFVR